MKRTPHLLAACLFLAGCSATTPPVPDFSEEPLASSPAGSRVEAEALMDAAVEHMTRDVVMASSKDDLASETTLNLDQSFEQVTLVVTCFGNAPEPAEVTVTSGPDGAGVISFISCNGPASEVAKSQTNMPDRSNFTVTVSGAPLEMVAYRLMGRPSSEGPA